MLVLRGHRAPVHLLTYAPDDRFTLASAAEDGTVRLWHPGVGRNWATFDVGPGTPTALAFSPDGDRLAVGLTDSRVLLWDLDRKQRPEHAWTFRHPAAALAFAPRGELLGVGLAEPGLALQLWDLTRSREPRVRRQPDGVGCLAFSPDGRTLAVAGRRNWYVELFDAEGDLRTRRGLLRFQGALRGLAFVPAPEENAPGLAAAAGVTVQLWETEPPRKRLVLKGHQAEVRCVAASRGGRVLSGSADGTVRVWDTAEGRELARYAWEVGPVRAVTAAPDGMTAAAAGAGLGIMVWDLD